MTASAPTAIKRVLDLASGTGLNQANVVWSDTRTLTTAQTDSLDLAGGGLTDPFGAAFAPAKVKAIIVASSSANTTNLTVFGDAAHVPFLGTVATSMTLTPGGFIVLTNPSLAGWVVTAATADIIKIVNAAGASATYDIVVIGTSA